MWFIPVAGIVAGFLVFMLNFEVALTLLSFGSVVISAVLAIIAFILVATKLADKSKVLKVIAFTCIAYFLMILTVLSILFGMF